LGKRGGRDENRAGHACIGLALSGLLAVYDESKFVSAAHRRA
jgi:hypothetical protein